MAVAGAQQGGHGGPVNVSGGDVRITGGIDSRPGRGVDTVGRNARHHRDRRARLLTISGTTDASGDVSTSGNGSDGGTSA